MSKTTLVRERAITSGSIGHLSEGYRILLREELDENGKITYKMLISVSAPYEVPVDLCHLAELLIDAGFVVKWPIKIDKKSNRRIFK